MSSPTSSRKWPTALYFVLVLATLCTVMVAGMALIAAPQPVNMANPLAPPDTSSPAATLNSVRNETAEAASIINKAFEHHIHSPGLFADDETLRASATARAHLSHAMRGLDLSAIPPTNRDKVGTERLLMLSEVLERLPPLTPEQTALAAASDRNAWTYPNTEIRIARMQNGPRAGEFLFTAETIERAPEFYHVLGAAPDRDRFDFYKFYSLSPGDLMPPKWYGWVRSMPDWMLADYNDQALWQWIGYGLTLLLFLLVTVTLIIVTHGRTARHYIPVSIRRLPAPIGILIAAQLADMMLSELNITGAPYSVSHAALIAAEYIAGAWFAAVLLISAADWMANASGVRPRSIDAGMMRLTVRIVASVAAAGILAFGAAELGLPLVGIVAGLGVGGLAIALAAQPTIENFIGGVMIFADRPVRIGDQCKFGNISGVVEEIGIRSTRIRASDRTLITIPNADFSKQRLINVDRRDKMVINTKIGLRYGTTQAQIGEILGAARNFFDDHADVDGAASSLQLVDFGPHALDLELKAVLKSTNKDDVAPLREEILLHIAGIVEKAGSGLAERDPRA